MFIDSTNLQSTRERAFAVDACITIAVIEEAVRRHIKIELPYDNFKIMRLYLKESEQPLEIRRLYTHNSSMIGGAITKDKCLSYQVAAEVGMRILPWRRYKDDHSARQFYQAQGGNCIIKPSRGSAGRGIVTKFAGESDFVERLATAQPEEDMLMQAKSAGRNDLRLLFVGSSMVAATATTPASVIGHDGKTLRQLVDEENDRRKTANTTLYPTMQFKILDLDQVCLITGRDLEDVIMDGQRVDASLSNVTKGGVARDATGVLHQSFVAEASRIVAKLHLSVVAIDFICNDPSLAVDDQANDAYFLEANSSPGIDLHMYPHEGEGINVAGAFIDYLIYM